MSGKRVFHQKIFLVIKANKKISARKVNSQFTKQLLLIALNKKGRKHQFALFLHQQFKIKNLQEIFLQQASYLKNDLQLVCLVFKNHLRQSHFLIITQSAPMQIKNHQGIYRVFKIKLCQRNLHQINLLKSQIDRSTPFSLTRAE